MKDILSDTGQYQWLGATYRPILTTAETGGAMSVTEIVNPASEGPPRHIHKAEDETFLILSGDVEFWLDGARFVRGPGESAFIPRGTPHTFRVTESGPARFLLVLTPGGFEGFWREGAYRAWRIPEDMAAVSESAERHNLTFTGPPLEG